MVETIMKRDGRTVEFKQEKIAEAVERAFQACGPCRIARRPRISRSAW
ncbi:MAG: ATP cone domain-containing protein [Eggerthellaceae bacterium]